MHPGGLYVAITTIVRFKATEFTRVQTPLLLFFHAKLLFVNLIEI